MPYLGLITPAAAAAAEMQGAVPHEPGWCTPRFCRMVERFYRCAEQMVPQQNADMLARAWANKLHYRCTYPAALEAELARVLESMY